MIIAINGLPNSGKDTIGSMIQNRLNIQMDFSHIEEVHKTKRWKIKKFATYANYMYSQIKRIDFSNLPREEKELERPQFISFCEGMKSIFGRNVWANLLLRDYTLKDNWIITDLRFSEELDMIEEVGGFVYTIHITSPNELQGINELQYVNFDYKIVNDGSIEELKDKVQVMLNQMVVI